MIDIIHATIDSLGWWLLLVAAVLFIVVTWIVNVVRRTIHKVIATVISVVVIPSVPSIAALQAEFGARASEAGKGLFEYITSLYGG